MKFLEDVYFSSTCIQNFSSWHALFVCLFFGFFYHILQPLRHGAGYSVKTHR